MKGAPKKNPVKGMNDFVRNWVVNNVETTAPAVIVSVDNYSGQRTVDVQPLLLELEEDGNVIVPPVIFNCPVTLQGTFDGYSSFPLQVGDTVAIAYCKRSIEEVTFGGTAELVMPKDRRLFGCSDVVVLGYWAQNKDHSVSATDWETRFKDSYLRISPDNKISRINPNATEEIDGDGGYGFTNGSVTVVYNADGTASITASSDITITSTATVNINGNTVNPNGSVDFASGASATASGDFVTAAGNSLDDLYTSYLAHGNGAPNHNPPVPPP